MSFSIYVAIRQRTSIVGQSIGPSVVFVGWPLSHLWLVGPVCAGVADCFARSVTVTQGAEMHAKAVWDDDIGDWIVGADTTIDLYSYKRPAVSRTFHWISFGLTRAHERTCLGCVRPWVPPAKIFALRHH